LLRKTRSLLEELESLRLLRDRENLVESRATHVIQGAINLLNFIKENYSFSILINSTSNTSSDPGPIEGLGELSP